MATPVPPASINWEQVEAISAVVSVVLSLATTIVAVFVFWEARSIRKTEWFSKTIQNWQEFNRLVISANYGERWSEIIKGDHRWQDLNQRDYIFIYSFLNVLVFEFRAQQSHLLDRDYAHKSVRESIAYFRHIWPDLRAHLSTDGWPDEFLPFADEVISAANLAQGALRP
jgi:hypothetical protein